MIIENPDAFKSWLTSILEPLCDADPAALAKYVYALVKKDKPLDELRDGMLDQLDVFLQHETRPFVDMLFKSLETQEYLKASVEEEKKQPSPPPEPTELEKEPENENHVPPLPPAEKPPIRARVESGNGAHRVVVPRSRPHPPHEQTLVKLLPTELLEEPVEPPRRRERRTDSLRDKEERRRRRSRSWERRARPRRVMRDGEHERRCARRPPSRSPSPRGRYRNRSPPPVVADRHTSRSRSRSPPGPMRDRELERERDRLRVPREMERDRMSRDREHRDRISRSRDRDRSRERSRDRSMSPHGDTRLEHTDPFKRRCRDFDVKGYCMRGDLCEWDHGVDPVVLEDATLTRVLAIPPPVPEYNPAAPDIWGGGVVSGFAPPSIPHLPHMPHHLAPRELVPIPRVRHEPPMGATMPPAPRHPAPMKKNFDYNRLGPSRPSIRHNTANCSLEVKKVPPGLNDITHLNNHFCKFGKIVNIQVCYEGDPEGALITFSNPTEANVAYKSTEAVLNNRFIKVFWHNPENKQENTAPGGQQANKPTDRNAHLMSHNKVLINMDNIKATADNKQNAEKLALQLAKETANGQEPIKEPVKKVDTSKQVQEMHRRAQALLQTQLTQQKLLIERLETGNGTEQQKAALMEAINASQEGIEKLRKELVAYNGMAKQMQDESVSRSLSRLHLHQANAKKPKTPQEAQKEILDAELDIITKQQEGQDVTELARKIAEMRRQMALQFPTHAGIRRPHSRGGRFNSAMRYTRGGLAAKGFSVNQSVDHRPRALLVSGFEPEELDALQAHFAQFGEITAKEVNLSVPELVVQYRARAHAEQALLRARNYNDRTLSITWVTNNKALSAAPAHNGATNNAAPENKEVQTPQELSEDALLRFDEEEEDEEDRSWRR
ncbi:RNA-binding protein 26 isoform X3 [Maniola jurtina]|uniref:RNA-binding protein 26 isoform X3 n=1 Tax=Maniola jurtina TaxID=191418 RepID=UPI001E68B236|nr:RNA-binding protein 26 isoform X3 [Maniola jurtina]